MHRIETEHFPIVICFSGEEKMLHHNLCSRWVHLYMETPRDATQYPLCVRASSVTVISGMLVYMDTPKDATQYPLCVRASSVTVISGMLVYMDTPKDATQYPLCVRASSVTVISGMLVYDSHVVFLQPQINCEVLSQAMAEG